MWDQWGPEGTCGRDQGDTSRGSSPGSVRLPSATTAGPAKSLLKLALMSDPAQDYYIGKEIVSCGKALLRWVTRCAQKHGPARPRLPPQRPRPRRPRPHGPAGRRQNVGFPRPSELQLPAAPAPRPLGKGVPRPLRRGVSAGGLSRHQSALGSVGHPDMPDQKKKLKNCQHGGPFLKMSLAAEVMTFLARPSASDFAVSRYLLLWRIPFNGLFHADTSKGSLEGRGNRIPLS